MNRILIVFAHPVLENSRVHIKLLRAAQAVKGVTINDLYEKYPDFDIDIAHEKQLLVEHDIIIWQHPLFWYSGPSLLKQWIDLVLEHGWAYGRQGKNLQGKLIFNAISSGGGEDVYQASGMQGCTLKELLKPFELTARLCQMHYLPPFWVPGSHRLHDHSIDEYAAQYQLLLSALREKAIDLQHLESSNSLNSGTTVINL
jgi:glutathione-regulated potassium-efflux system ancillary protein KefG